MTELEEPLDTAPLDEALPLDEPEEPPLDETLPLDEALPLDVLDEPPLLEEVLLESTVVSRAASGKPREPPASVDSRELPPHPGTSKTNATTKSLRRLIAHG
jgi:hypothetical protein